MKDPTSTSTQNPNPNSNTTLTLLHSIQEYYRKDEETVLAHLLKENHLPNEVLQRIHGLAKKLVIDLRRDRLKKGGLDAFLYQYDLSSEEGIALMCLAEALLRIPDKETRDRLIKDKIVGRDFEQHMGKSHSLFVNAGTFGLMLTGKVLSREEIRSGTLQDALKRLANRLGEPIIRKALTEGMKILGKQFVMGETIEEALERATENEAKGYCYSYDMLGEAAKTDEDALHYLTAYQKAIEKIGIASQNRGPIVGPGVSVKLSALHPRYEWVNRSRVMKELLPRLKALVLQARDVNIGFTIDAEEASRLELSFGLIEAIQLDPDLKD